MRIIKSLVSFFIDVFILIVNPSYAIKYLKSRYERREDDTLGFYKSKFDTNVKPVTSSIQDSVYEMLEHNHKFIKIRSMGQFNWIGIKYQSTLTILRQIINVTPELEVYRDGIYKLDITSGNLRGFIKRSSFIDVIYNDNLGRLSTLRMDIYNYNHDGAWISKSEHNKTCRVIRDRFVFEKSNKNFDGVKFADECNFPIDIVYTWVNHEDEEWSKIYSLHKNNLENDSNSLKRFHNKNELKYSLRSVNKYLPWANSIYIVSNCKPPEWLDLDHEKINWVRHDDIIPDEFLPTFNSHVIESFLHKIENLKEHFLYLNDDVLITSMLLPEDLFTSNGSSRSFLETYGTVNGELDDSSPDYLNASRNSASLINSSFNSFPTRLHNHTIFCLLKSILGEIEEKYSENFLDFRSNKFRSLNDLNTTSFLYHGYALQTGFAQEGFMKTALVKNNSPKSLKYLDRSRFYKTICVNEGQGKNVMGWEKKIKYFFKNTYSQPADWEIY